MIRKKVNYPAQRGIQCSACTVREAGLGVNKKDCCVVSFDLKIRNFPLKRYFKGIDRSFELRGKIRYIRSVMTNWRLGSFFYLILNGLHHKISKKPIVAA
jgi:hypothetical protein